MKNKRIATVALFIVAGISSAGIGLAQDDEPRGELAGSGVKMFFSYTGEVFSVVTGGNSTGVRFSSLLDYGADFDLEKLSILPGSSVHLHFHTLESNSLSNLVGDFSTLSSIDGHDTTRLYQLSFQKDYESGFSFRTGLIDLDDDFMDAEWNNLFINSNFGPMVIQSANNAAPIWPIGAPGIWASYAPPASNWFVQSGIYDGNMGKEEVNDNGLRIRINGTEGLMYMLEGGVTTEVSGRPTTFKLGGFHHTGDEFDDFLTGRTASGNRAFWGIAQHELSDQLRVYARGGIAPSERKNTVSSYAETGLNFTVLPNRPDDVFGIGFTYTKFSGDYVAANPGVTNNEQVLECTYLAQITDSWSTQFDLQWIAEPHEGQSSALVLGVRFVLDF